MLAEFMGSERQNIISHDDGEEDRISELPDSVLEHILAFLPTKTAVWTSILSKRWRNVWTAVPILHFDLLEQSRTVRDGSVRERRLEAKKMMNFVDTTLSLHEMPKLLKFYLSFVPYIDYSRVNEWITTAINRNVEKLILFSDLTKHFRLPCCLFTCESLIELDITTVWDVIDLPNAASFPKLKVIKLTKINIEDENWTQQFFSNCPVLEQLVLDNCIFWGLKFLSISSPKLKSLSINNPSGAPVVKIYAPSLSSFTFVVFRPLDYVLHSFPSLVHADIYLTCEANSMTMKEKRGYVAAKLLEKLSNVNRLRINSSILLAMSFEDGFLTNFPTFHNLIHLEVRSDTLNLIARTILDFLQISPNLESIIFARGLCGSNISADWTPNLVPSLLNLKSVEFHEFSGNPTEVIMVKFFLKHAGVLQKMTLTSEFSSKEREKIMKQLIQCPKASTGCVVTIQSSRKTIG